MLKITYIIMIMYYVTPMTQLSNGFYLFPLSRAVNSNRLIFDQSEIEIHLNLFVDDCLHVIKFYNILPVSVEGTNEKPGIHC